MTDQPQAIGALLAPWRQAAATMPGAPEIRIVIPAGSVDIAAIITAGPHFSAPLIIRQDDQDRPAADVLAELIAAAAAPLAQEPLAIPAAPEIDPAA